MEWIAWLGNLFKMLGDLFPQRLKVPPTHRGIKYKRMRVPIVLYPGVYWWWPWRSDVKLVIIAQQTLWLEEQKLMTADGRAMLVRGSITWRIFDKDDAIIKASVDTWEVEQQIDDEAMGVYCDYLVSRSYKEIQDSRQEVNKELTRQVRKRLEGYGVRVIRAQLTSFATGMPLLHMGT